MSITTFKDWKYRIIYQDGRYWAQVREDRRWEMILLIQPSDDIDNVRQALARFIEQQALDDWGTTVVEGYNDEGVKVWVCNR